METGDRDPDDDDRSPLKLASQDMDLVVRFRLWKAAMGPDMADSLVAAGDPEPLIPSTLMVGCDELRMCPSLSTEMPNGTRWGSLSLGRLSTPCFAIGHGDTGIPSVYVNYSVSQRDITPQMTRL